MRITYIQHPKNASGDGVKGLQTILISSGQQDTKSTKRIVMRYESYNIIFTILTTLVLLNHYNFTDILKRHCHFYEQKNETCSRYNNSKDLKLWLDADSSAGRKVKRAVCGDCFFRERGYTSSSRKRWSQF